MASVSLSRALYSWSLARTDESRLKNVTIKTFLPHPGVHHLLSILSVFFLSKIKCFSVLSLVLYHNLYRNVLYVLL